MNDITNSSNSTSSLKWNVKFDDIKIQQILNITIKSAPNSASLFHLNDFSSVAWFESLTAYKLSLNPQWFFIDVDFEMAAVFRKCTGEI